MYSQVSISVTPISVIISYMLRKFYSPTKTQLVRLVSVIVKCYNMFYSLLC